LFKELLGVELHVRKEVSLMQWVTPDFEVIECAGEVTMYVDHW